MIFNNTKPMKNNTQKSLLIIGFISFIFWFFSPLSIENNGIHKLEYYLSHVESIDFFRKWYQILSFSLIFGSILGIYLFRDDKDLT